MDQQGHNGTTTVQGRQRQSSLHGDELGKDQHLK